MQILNELVNDVLEICKVVNIRSRMANFQKNARRHYVETFEVTNFQKSLP